MAKLIWRNAETNFLLKSPQGEVGRDLMRRAVAVQQAAKAQVGVKTGELRKSIHIRRRPNNPAGQQIEVGSNLKYALLHHEGTKPHVILPVVDSQLVFSSGGRIIRTNRVNHPGTRANKYLTDNLPLALIDP
jgi:hypothetical protein